MAALATCYMNKFIFTFNGDGFGCGDIPASHPTFG